MVANQEQNIKEEKGDLDRKESTKEEVEEANESDLVKVKTILLAFQEVEVEPKEDFLHSYENVIIPVHVPLLNNFQPNPQKNPK